MLDKKIEYFMCTVQEGSFSAAARKLLLSQPALSQQISLLEQSLGVQLFDREGYRPVLTRPGRMFYEGCMKIWKQCEALELTVRDAENRVIRIGFTGANTNRELFELVRMFKHTHPNVSFTFLESSVNGCAAKLLRHDIDLSFGIDSESWAI